MKNKLNFDYVYKFCKQHNLDLPKEGQTYKNTKQKMIFICNKHGEQLQAVRAKLYQKQKCPKCSHNYPKTIKTHIEECKRLNIDIPLYTEIYKNRFTKLKYQCNNCGNIYSQTPDAHINQKQGCPICGKLKRINSQLKTSEDYDTWLSDNTNIIRIEKYRGAHHAIKHKCLHCGHLWKTKPNNVKYGRGCPCCNQSHGEKYIQLYLNKKQIKYEIQKKFKNLKDVNMLSYDFYLPSNNILIEYQGIQHYESVSFNGRDYSNLEKQQYHDKLKRKYAKDNGYILLEISYKNNTFAKISKLLDKYL